MPNEVGLGLGDVSRLIRGETRGFVSAAHCVWPLALPFVCGEGPSSTIQSLRSMKEVLWPRFGGEGEGEYGFREVSSLNWDFLGIEEEEEGVVAPRDSKAEILDCRAADGMEVLVRKVPMSDLYAVAGNQLLQFSNPFQLSLSRLLSHTNRHRRPFCRGTCR